MSAPGQGNKAIVAAFSANLGIAIAKFIGFLFTKSTSMLAESVHSLADTGNQGLLLLGGKRAARPATDKHQFGHGAERYFWAFIVALVLFLGGAAFAIYEGIAKIRHPHELESPLWAVVILVVAIGLESYSFKTALNEASHACGDASLKQYLRNSRSPELPVVVLEDLGALVGLGLALAGVVLTVLTGNGVFDGVGTLSIGILLAVIAVVLAVKMKSLLIGVAALVEHDAAIRAALVDGGDIVSVIHLRTLHIGPESLLIAAKIEAAANLSLAALANAIDSAEARVRAVLPLESVIYLEPDLRRTLTE